MNTSHPTATFDEWLDGMRAHIAEIRASLLEAAAALEGQPPAAEPVVVVDFWHEAYKQLQQAASESSWMPPEYFANDWIADCCRWLREGPPPERDVSRILLEITPGPDGMGHEVYAASVADVEERLSSMGQRIEDLEGVAMSSAAQAAVRTLTRLGYTHTGGVEWRPPVGPRPAFVEPGTVLRGRTIAELDEIARSAQIAFCLGKFPSFEVAFARGIEAALGIGVPS